MRTSGWSFFIALMVPNVLMSKSLSAADNKKPNIIVIISDEHNPSIMGCSGNRVVNTPNLDALASRGVVFNSQYCSSPICVPSRQTLTVGKYVSHHNVWGNSVGVPNDVVSLPRLFTQNGYESILIGGMKYNGLNYGFSSYSIENKVIPPKDKVKSEKQIIPRSRKRIPAGEFRDNGDEIGEEFKTMGASPDNMESFTDVARRNEALSFIQGRKSADKPFFLIVGFMAPHYPLEAPAELIAKYKDKVPMPEIPDGYLETLPLNYKHLRNDRKMEKITPEIVKLGRESYYARVEWADQQIGQVLDALNKSPMADNTIVIYTADHGENLGEHGLWWKNAMFDNAAKVPLIISYPKRWTGGQKRDEACGSVDLVKTIAELGGLETPKDWDGVSMVPWLDNPAYKWKNMAVCEYYAGYIASGISMIRKGNWKYVYHSRADETHGPEVELYDLHKDPKELINLGKDPNYADTIKMMHASLIKELGEDPEHIELRFRAGAIPEVPNGTLK